MERMKNRPFVVIGVNSDSRVETLREVESAERLPYRSIFDGGSRAGPVARIWGVAAWPTAVLIDHEGVIQARGLMGDTLDAAIEQLVARAERSRAR